MVTIKTELNKKRIDNDSNSQKEKEKKNIIIHGNNMIKHLKG